MRLQLSAPHHVSSQDEMISRVTSHGPRMRAVDAHLLEEKMDEAVTHYINSHPTSEAVHVDASTLSLNVHDNAVNRVVTVMHSQNFPPQMCRQVPVGEQVGDGPWTEELLDPEGRLAALVAQIAQNSRTTHVLPHHKIPSRGDEDSSVMLESPLRLFNGQTLEPQQDSLVVDVPTMPALPPLQQMKRCPEPDWFGKAKISLKDAAPLSDPPPESAGVSPGGGRQQSRKSLPHKKRISRKLKRNQLAETQEDIVVINCTDEVQQEEILPDSYAAAVQHPQVPGDAHHIAHEMRAILICQICGEFYGEEQLRFYQHLRQHYEPHATIIIENPEPELPIDKITNACIVDNVATLPDSIVELSLENTLPKTTIYQPIDKHIIYSSNDKTFYSSTKSHYSMANMGKEDVGKVESDIYETVGKVEVYSCTRCNKSFKKQKHCEAHIKEMHTKLTEELNEFSEPEDLMEGIHVAVDEELEPALPHLTVDNGTVRQDHVRHWYMSRDSSCDEAPCSLCVPRDATQPANTGPDHLKEEIIQRIFDVEAQHEAPFTHSLLPPTTTAGSPHVVEEPPATQMKPEAIAKPDHQDPQQQEEGKKSKRQKKFSCVECGRVFNHRNSLLYHALLHGNTRPHACEHCPKRFYTRGALKIHGRVHNGDRPYKCEECGRLFRQWGDLRYHVASIHSAEKNFKCDYCGKQFARKYSLDVHRRIHTGEKNHPCRHCGKTFSTASYRATHERTHTGYKPHKCEECGKSFRMAGDLRRHLLIHEKAKNRIDTDKKKKSPSKDQIAPEDIKKEPEEQEENKKKVKKIATASTTRLPVQKIDKKKMEKSPKKNKKAAPNVVVQKEDEARRMEIYSDQNIIVEAYCRESFDKSKESERFEDREFATLRPMYRSNDIQNTEVEKEIVKENTDGKLTVFTHLEKSRDFVPNSHIISDIRQNIELRERREIVGEAAESAFLERLTAMYNIPV